MVVDDCRGRTAGGSAGWFTTAVCVCVCVCVCVVLNLGIDVE